MSLVIDVIQQSARTQDPRIATVQQQRRIGHRELCDAVRNVWPG